MEFQTRYKNHQKLANLIRTNHVHIFYIKGNTVHKTSCFLNFYFWKLFCTILFSKIPPITFVTCFGMNEDLDSLWNTKVKRMPIWLKVALTFQGTKESFWAKKWMIRKKDFLFLYRALVSMLPQNIIHFPLIEAISNFIYHGNLYSSTFHNFYYYWICYKWNPENLRDNCA